jgi:hypothetical protein
MAIQIVLNRPVRPVLAGVLACLAGLLSSCSKDSRPPVHPVRGRVLDSAGRPAEGALVVFHPADGSDDEADKPRGRADAQGYFQLTTYENEDGAPEGEYVVTVDWRPRKKTPFGPETAHRLQGRYSSRETTPLRAIRIDKDTTELTPFRLR